MVKMFSSPWNWHPKLIKSYNTLIDLFNDEFKPVHSTPFLGRPKARQFASGEVDQMLSERGMEPMTTDMRALIVVAPKNDDLRAFPLTVVN